MSENKHANRYQGPLSLVSIYVLLAVGFGGIAVGASSQVAPPRPETTAVSIEPDVPAALEGVVFKPQPQPKAEPEALPVAPVAAADLPASLPQRISIPTIEVTSDIIQVGKDGNNEVEVPAGGDYDKVAWYKHSVTPGEIGSSVLLGHVDSIFTGPSIFFELGGMKAGEIITVNRADGTTATFKVDAVKEYLKDDFPTYEVYGDTANSTLKLVTCSGAFDSQSGEYDSNVIVFATLSSESS